MVLTRGSFGHVTLQEPPRNKFIPTRELSRFCDLSNVRGMLFIKTPRRPSCQSGSSACVPFFERSEGRSRGISRTSEYYRSSTAKESREMWVAPLSVEELKLCNDRIQPHEKKVFDDYRSGLRQG